MAIVYFQMNQIIIDPARFTPAARWQVMVDVYSCCKQEGSCTVWSKALNTSGYPTKKFRLPNYPIPKNILVSRLLFSFATGTVLGGQYSEGLQMSHLCHNKKCLNLDHLNLEPRGINNLRRSCVWGGACSGHVTLDGRTYPQCLLW